MEASVLENLRPLLPAGYQSLEESEALQLVEILHGTSPWSSWITAGSARSSGGPGRGWLGRNSKDRELRSKFRAAALGAGGFLIPIHQGLEMVLALLADVFKNGHGILLPWFV